MFSNIFQKTALLGASTVASVALTGTIMANSAQAGTMSYTSQFSVTSNSLNSEVVTGDFSFTKTELTGEDSGLFSYTLTDFNANLMGVKSLTLKDVKGNPNPFLAFNTAFIPDKYQGILPRVLANENSHYKGDGDFPPEDFTFGFDLKDGNFQAENFDFVLSEKDLDNAATLVSTLAPSMFSNRVKDMAIDAFAEGGTVSFATTSTSVPEPTTIFGLGIVGIGLTATRRKRKNKKIKQEIAA